MTTEKTKEARLLRDLRIGLDNKSIKIKYGFGYFKDLKKYKLIEKDAKGVYVLTYKGRAVANHGLFDYISYRKTEDYLLSYSCEKSKRENLFTVLAGLIIIILLTFLLLMPEGQQLLMKKTGHPTLPAFLFRNNPLLLK